MEKNIPNGDLLNILANFE